MAFVLSKPVLNNEILSLDPSKLTQLLPKRVQEDRDTRSSAWIQESDAAVLYDFKGERFLEVTAERATLVHQEHAAIELPKGTYRVWIQREYSPEEIRRVVD